MRKSQDVRNHIKTRPALCRPGLSISIVTEETPVGRFTLCWQCSADLGWLALSGQKHPPSKIQSFISWWVVKGDNYHGIHSNTLIPDHPIVGNILFIEPARAFKIMCTFLANTHPIMRNHRSNSKLWSDAIFNHKDADAVLNLQLQPYGDSFCIHPRMSARHHVIHVHVHTSHIRQNNADTLQMSSGYWVFTQTSNNRQRSKHTWIICYTIRVTVSCIFSNIR